MGEHKASLQSTEIRKKALPNLIPLGEEKETDLWEWAGSYCEGGVKDRANKTDLNGDWAWSWLCVAVLKRSFLHGPLPLCSLGAARDFYSLPQGKPMRTSNPRLSLVKIKPYCHLVDREFILLFFFFLNSEPDSSIQNLTNHLVELRCVSHHCKVSWSLQFQKAKDCSLSNNFMKQLFVLTYWKRIQNTVPNMKVYYYGGWGFFPVE